ncbi:MAG: hypothetical protein RL736_619 [Pseudomonadota bacterium]|jgi:hypothetical protein
MHKYTVIVTKNNSDYINWQTNVLYESFLEYHKNDKNFKFIALVSKDQKYLESPNYPYIYFNHINVLNNDNYIVYNRILSLREYLRSIELSENRYIILLDPDFIFLKKFDLDISTTTAQFCSYLINHEVLNFFQKTYESDVKDFYCPVACPYIINEVLLSKIIDRWLELAVDFRTNNIKDSPLYQNWICEMYAFSFALAENKIQVDIKNFCESPPGGDYISNENLIFYHYCYDIRHNKTNQLVFGKRSYKFGHYIDLNGLEYNIGKDSYNFISNFNYFTKKLGAKEQVEEKFNKAFLTPQIIPY